MGNPYEDGMGMGAAGAYTPGPPQTVNPYKPPVIPGAPPDPGSPQVNAPEVKPPDDGPLDLSGLFEYQRQQQNGPITDPKQFDNLLSQLRKFDPNAHFEYRDNSGSSNEGGRVTPNSYELVFDQGKLPDPGGTRKGTLPFNSAGQAQGIQQLDAGEGFRSPELYKPGLSWKSPYGTITDSRNVNTTSGSDMLWKFAPALIMAIATMGAGTPLAAGLMGAGGGGLEGFLASVMPSLLEQGANTHGFSGGVNMQQILGYLARAFTSGAGGG